MVLCLFCHFSITYLPFKFPSLFIYRLPSGDFNLFLERLSQLLDSVNLSLNIIFTGDFNVHFLDSNDLETLQLNNLLVSYGLFPTVQFNTRYNNCLDNIFTNQSPEQYSVKLYPLYSLSDHSGVIFNSSLSAPPSGNIRVNYRPVTEQGLFDLYNTIETVDWSFIAGAEESVDAKCKQLIGVITDAVERSFPLKSKMIDQRAREINWFNDRLREMRDRLQMLVIINKQNPILMPKCMVSEYRRQYRQELTNTKKTAYDNFLNRSTNKQSAMWGIIKSHNNNTKPNSQPGNLSAETFNNYFINVAEQLINELPDPVKTFDNFLTGSFVNKNFNFSQVTYNMVRDKIGKLRNSDSKDCYNLTTKIAKTLKNVIVIPLTNLINLCISNNNFPSALKIARVVPIYKNKGSVDDQTNFRPISLLPVLSKILESVIKDQISTYFENNNILTQCQYGFRNKKSTTLAIDGLTQYVADGLDKRLDTYASFFDLTKAFDCVSFNILLHKLSYYGFSPEST